MSNRSTPLKTATRGIQYASQESVNELTKKVDKLMEMVGEWLTIQKNAPPPPTLPPPSLDSLAPILEDVTRKVHESCSQALSDKQEYESKEKRVVVIGAEEKKDEKERLSSDQKLVQSLMAHCEDPDVIQAWDDGAITFHRHPKTREPGRRPLKIELPSKALRDSLLSSIRTKPGRPLPAPAFLRKDLTPHEFDLERQAREEVKAKNLAAGKIVYGLRDFTVITYRIPRDLPPNYGTPRASLPNRSADHPRSGSGPLTSASISTDATANSTGSDVTALSSHDATPAPPSSSHVNTAPRKR